MGIGSIVLEYLKVLLTGPVIGGAVALTFIVMFRQPIKSLIARIASIKIPGGAELLTPQQPPEGSADKTPHVPVSQDEPPLLPASLSDPELEQIQEVLNAERARAYVWEYRYLNLFLVPATVLVLEWFASLTVRITIGMYDAFWSTTVREAEQRTTILSVLESHRLVQRDGDIVAITEKGREYLEWKDRI